jgi:hypothetical protein
MIAGCTLWAQQNNLVNSESLEEIKASASDLANTDVANTDVTKTDVTKTDVATLTDHGKSISRQLEQNLAATRPLPLPIVGG